MGILLGTPFFALRVRSYAEMILRHLFSCLSLLSVSCVLLWTSNSVLVHHFSGELGAVDPVLRSGNDARAGLPWELKQIAPCSSAYLSKGKWVKTHERILSSRKRCSRWEPTRQNRGKCRLVEWEAKQFCNVSAGTTILMLGFDENDATKQLQDSLLHPIRGCKNGLRTIAPEEWFDEGNGGNVQALGEDAPHARHFPELFLLQSSAKVLENDKTHQVLEVIKKWWSKCLSANKFTCHLIWTTSPVVATACEGKRTNRKEYIDHNELIQKHLQQARVSHSILDTHQLVKSYPPHCCTNAKIDLQVTYQQLLLQSLVEWRALHTSSEHDILPAKEIAAATSAVRRRFSNDTTMSSTLPLCEPQDIKWGKWIPQRLAAPPYASPFGAHENDSCAATSSDYWDTWKWLPQKQEQGLCLFHDWDPDLFCEAASGNAIMIAGDSLSWEHFQSMISLFDQGAPYQESRVFDRNKVDLVCNGTVKLVFRRSNYLENLEDAIQTDFPNVLVLNKGAHYQENRVFTQTLIETINVVRIWLDQCETKGRKCHLIWRTSVPGHIRCETFTEPVNDLAAIEAYVSNQSNYPPQKLNYNWQNFREQNEIALKLLAEQFEGNITVLDAYFINILRPDGHATWRPDCLHNCYPGKMDVYSRILMHYLLLKSRSNPNRESRLKS